MSIINFLCNKRLSPGSLSANYFDTSQKQQGELTDSTLHLLPANTSVTAETHL